MKITALIPAYNDDYTLSLCLASIVEHFDEIIVLDDASTDATPDVAYAFAEWHPHVRFLRNSGPQLGWVEARNRLLALTDSEHLFWLDADDVLCEYNAGMLREIAAGPRPAVRLQLCEMWGDLDHTTQRLKHYDRCHLYVNRRLYRDMVWWGCAMASPVGAGNAAIMAGPSDGPLLFHLKGVKPDRRLVERGRIRGYLRVSDRPDRLVDFCRLEDMSPDEIHARAIQTLLKNRGDRLTPTYLFADPSPLAPAAARPPRRPEVIEAALPGRFRMVYVDGWPIDRIDTEGAGPERERDALTRPQDCEDSPGEGADPQTLSAGERPT